MKDLWIISVPQEYQTANHKSLWHEIADQLNGTADVVILDIPSDLIVTVIKRKMYRIKESKEGIKQIKNNLFICRPFYFLRPEVSPGFVNYLNMFLIRRLLNSFFPNFKDRQKYLLCYGGKQLGLLSGIDERTIKLYYIVDEVSRFAHNGKLGKKKAKLDIATCKIADWIFVMSKAIAIKRVEFMDKITVLGNGSQIAKDQTCSMDLKKTVGFIGRFRSWIDFDLLNELVLMRKDILFCFAGPIEKNVRNEFLDLLNKNVNVAYFGELSKEQIGEMYKAISVTIVPYRKNTFISSTRPLKVVESVFCGTPAVTVPVSGYDPSSFIRFANTAEEFSCEIDYLLTNPIDFDQQEYRDFVVENSWLTKSQIVVDIANSIKSQKT